MTLNTFLLRAALLALTPLSASVAADSAIEFYNTPLKHYFITVDSAEATAIESGQAGPGWTKTGKTFNISKSTGVGLSAVCRFYGNQAKGGPNSHFYTSDAAECAAVKNDAGWQYERIEFYVQNKVAAACPAGSAAVYRNYNGRAMQRDTNHRYTTDLTTYNEMIAQGWAGEGVVFCASSGAVSPPPATTVGVASDNCGAVFVQGKRVRFSNVAQSDGVNLGSSTFERDFLTGTTTFDGKTATRYEDIYLGKADTSYFVDQGNSWGWMGGIVDGKTIVLKPYVAYPKTWAVGQVMNYDYSQEVAGIGIVRIVGTLTLVAREAKTVAAGTYANACKMRLEQTATSPYSVSKTVSDVWSSETVGMILSKVSDTTVEQGVGTVLSSVTTELIAVVK
jgi:Repeat of unknown function (DUF5648)